MGLQKNTASQKWRVFAFDTTDGTAKTGDAANITAKIALDWGTANATNDVNPTEVEDGYYTFDLTQAETDADALDLYPESATANIQVIGVPGSQGTRRLGEVIYEEGAIWIDPINGTAGAVDFVNGISRLPVAAMADANTLATSLKLARFKVAPSNISNILLFGAAQDFQIFDAHGSWIDINGQSVDGTSFVGCLVLGTALGAGNYRDVTLGTTTFAGGIFWRCAITAVTTLSTAASYYFDQCFGAGATPTIDFGAAVGNTTVYMQDYQGEINIANLGATPTDVLNLSGNGHLILASSCTGGTVNIRGNWNLTNNGSGITINQDARYELSRILADSVAFNGANVDATISSRATPAQVATELATYDGPTKAEMDTAHGLLATPAQVATELATYDGPTNAEMEARTLDAAGTILLQEQMDAIVRGNCQAGGTATSIVLAAGAITSDDQFNGGVIRPLAGTGFPQSGRQIITSTASTDTVTVDALDTAFDDTTDYEIWLAAPSSASSPAVVEVTKWNGVLLSTNDPLSDIESNLVLIYSDTAVIEAAGGVADWTAGERATILSDLTAIHSDTTIIDTATAALSTKQDSDMVVLDASHTKTQSDIADLSTKQDSDMVVLDASHTKTQSDIVIVDDFVDTEIASIISDIGDLSTKQDSDMVVLDASHTKTQSDITDLSTKQDSDMVVLDASHTKTQSDIVIVDDFVDTEIASIISDIADLSTKQDSDMVVLDASHTKTQSDIVIVDDFLDTEIATIISDIALLQVDLDTTTSDLVVLTTDVANLSTKQDSDMVVLDASHTKTQSDIVIIDDFVDTEITKIVSDTTRIETATAGAMAELAQAKPGATPTMNQALMLLYMMARNKFESTATQKNVYNDSGTLIAKSTLSDDGTTFTDDEMAAGP